MKCFQYLDIVVGNLKQFQFNILKESEGVGMYFSHKEGVKITTKHMSTCGQLDLWSCYSSHYQKNLFHVALWIVNHIHMILFKKKKLTN